MGSAQQISSLVDDLRQLRSEMVFVDPQDEATIIAFQHQAEQMVGQLINKGAGLGRYITFLKSEQKVVEAEADEYKSVYQKIANRAKAMETTIKWLMENPIRTVIETSGTPLVSDTRKFQVVKAPPAYKGPQDQEDSDFDLTMVHAKAGLFAEGTPQGDAARELLKYEVTPQPYINWAAVKIRMRELRKILTDLKEKANFNLEEIESMHIEWANLSQWVDCTQGDYVRMY